MDRYAVIGNPVEHSQSPWIHARFAERPARRCDYERLLAGRDGFAATVRALRRRAAARGCNVTVPFKFEAFALAAQASERARRAGAAQHAALRCRRLVRRQHRRRRPGARHRAQRRRRHRRPAPAAASAPAAPRPACSGPLLEARPAALVIANRTPDKAQRAGRARTRRWRAQQASRCAAAPLDDCRRRLRRRHQRHGEQPARRRGAGAARVLRARRAGARHDVRRRPRAASSPGRARTARVGRDGLGMLVEQAAEAFQVWRGVRPADRAGAGRAARAAATAQR